MVVPARRVAPVGGGFSTDEDVPLDDRLLNHVRDPRPGVCVVQTASGDAPACIDQLLSAFTSHNCEPSVLSLSRREVDDEALRAFLLHQDVVYAGDGHTVNLPAVWQADATHRVVEEALPCRLPDGATCHGR
ncbi:Type 1 glutamine amidotransferase-like domain-containing protein [Streptomyces sp. DHE7-1]|nr:Type 1 glutamine amidotransferase-like domain-containing protein [Streptomyces sp. DHE7-1]